MLHRVVIVVMLLFLAACDMATAPQTPRKAIAEAMTQVFPDAAMANFFTIEATQAGVSRVALVHLGPSGVYGDTAMTSDTRAPVVRINLDRRGSTAPTNLAHEISHAWAFRHGCYNHGERWLDWHMQIAERFEAAFPGVKWSGQSPTANVAAKGAHYPNDHC